VTGTILSFSLHFPQYTTPIGTLERPSTRTGSGTTPKLLSIKVVGDACENDAHAEDASPERGGAGEKEQSRRSHQSKQDGSRLFVELAEEYGVGVGTIWRALQPETKEAA
jgi:hypothetical protein